MMRVCCFLLVVLVLSTTSEFGLAQDSDSRDLREKQEVIACELARNDTFAEIFKSLIRQRHGVDPGDRKYDIVIYYALLWIICCIIEFFW